MEEVKIGICVNVTERERLDRVYGLTERGTTGVGVFLRSKIQAGSTKIRRYLERNIQFHQNNLFKNNQSNLYKGLSGSTTGNNPAPDAQEATEFWSGIWSESGGHERDAEWLTNLKLP